MHRVVNRFYSPLKPAAGRHGHRFSFSTLINDHDRVLTQWTAIEYIGDDDEVGLEAFFLCLSLEDRQGVGVGYVCCRLLSLF